MKYNITIKFALNVGEIMLENGADTQIIEHTIESIIKRLLNYDAKAIVLASVIFITVEFSEDNIITITRHVDKMAINLNRLYLIQCLLEKLKNDEIKIEEAIKNLEDIKNFITCKLITKTILCSVSSPIFVLLFNGSYLDSLSALITGSILNTFLHLSNKTTLSNFIINILGGIIIATSVIILLLFNIVDNKDIVIISCIMILAPGIVLTNGIHDILARNFLSGFTRIIDSTITATAISIGIGIILKLYFILGDFL